MANQRDPGPASLYAAMISHPMVRTLNANTRRTKREELLEVLLVAVMMEAGNGELRFPDILLFQADKARKHGRRLEHRFDEVTDEHVMTLTSPDSDPDQLKLGEHR